MLKMLNLLSNQISKIQSNNLYWIQIEKVDLKQTIERFNKDGIPNVDIGYELANSLNSMKDKKYMNIEAQEILQKLIESKSKFLKNNKIKAIIIYNLGILFEPELGLDPTKILKDISKSIAIILLWENETDNNGKLFWDVLKPKLVFDFNNINLKGIKIQNEI